MFTESQSKRIARHATAALIKAIDALPGLIEDAEPDRAAAVVADVVKTQLARPEPQPDPTLALQAVVRAAMSHAEE